MGSKAAEQIGAYVDAVCGWVRCKEVLPDIRAELEAHVEELVQDFVDHGEQKSEAVKHALEQMGDPDVIGKRLNRVHGHRIDWPLFGFFCALTAAGLFLQISFLLSSDNGHFYGPIGFDAVMQQFLPEGIGILMGSCCFFADFRRIAQRGLAIYILTLLSMIWVMIFGMHANGQFLLRVGPYDVDTASVAPFLLVIGLTGPLSKLNWRRHLSIWLVLLLFFVPLILFYRAHETAHGLEYGAAFFGALFLSGPDRKRLIQVISLCLLPIIGTIAIRWGSSPPWYRLRFTGYLHPYRHYALSGYWYVQAQKVFMATGVFGHGFASSNPLLPDSAVNLTFNYLLYAFGWIGAILFTVLMTGLVLRMCRTVQMTTHPAGRILAGGLLTVLSFKLIYSVLMGFGIVPIMAIHMPFVSPVPNEFGIEVIAIGLLLSIYRVRTRISSLPTMNDKPASQGSG